MKCTFNTTTTSNTTSVHLNRDFSLVLGCWLILAMSLGILFNIFLIYIITIKLPLHKPRNYFILNLAACDVLRTVTLLPFEIDTLFSTCGFLHGLLVCGLREMVFIFSLVLAIVNILLLTSERLLRLLMPFHHTSRVTPNKVFLFVFHCFLSSEVFI